MHSYPTPPSNPNPNPNANASSGSESHHYGVKSIRQLRNTKSSNPPGKSSSYSGQRPNLQKQQIIQNTYDYMLKEVDPIINDCIVYLLCHQPDNILAAMLDYLQNRQKGIKLQTSTFAAAQNSQNPVNKKPSKSQKLYLATQISPILNKIMNRLISSRPLNVLEFICQELKHLSHFNGEGGGDDDDRFASQINKDGSQRKSSQSSSSGAATSSSQQSHGPKNIQILIIGSGGVGKTSFVNAIQGKFDSNVRPTIGFRPTNMMMGDDKIKLYDLGGGVKIRGIWPEYFHDIHGVVYLIDSSVREEQQLADSIQLFHETFSHVILKEKPILIIANKQDIPGSLTAEEITQLYSINTILTGRNYHIAETSTSCLSSSSSPDEPEVIEQEADPRIETALEWLLKYIQNNYYQLNLKVEMDTKMKQQEEQQKRLAKERKVLKNKILSAFISQVDTSLLSDDMPLPNPEDIFTKEEGENFLASEIGEELSSLPEIALNIAALIGYQRLALQMVGALKAPISKKKSPMSWEEIYSLVVELRSELGL